MSRHGQRRVDDGSTGMSKRGHTQLNYGSMTGQGRANAGGRASQSKPNARPMKGQGRVDEGQGMVKGGQGMAREGSGDAQGGGREGSRKGQ